MSDGYQTYWVDHFISYANISPLCFTTETNMVCQLQLKHKKELKKKIKIFMDHPFLFGAREGQERKS